MARSGDAKGHGFTHGFVESCANQDFTMYARVTRGESEDRNGGQIVNR